MDKDEFRETVVMAAQTIEYGYKVYIDDEYIMAVAATQVFDNAMLDYKNDRITISEDINAKYDSCDIEILNKIDRDFLLETIDRESFKTLFFKNAKDSEIVNFISSLLK